MEVGDDVVHVHLALWRIYIRQKNFDGFFFFIGDPCCVCAKQTVHVRNMSSLLNVSTEQINEAITLSSITPRLRFETNVIVLGLPLLIVKLTEMLILHKWLQESRVYRIQWLDTHDQ